jgi:uncharacterized protein YecE (DUF72 family)
MGRKTKTKMSKLKDKLKEISSKISKIGRNGKANWIFFDKPKQR